MTDGQETEEMNGGELVADVLKARGVQFLFTLCGGHISPILVGAKQRGIRVVDVRHEANAVFAADAVARLTGIPGVAAVTAGPGVTNTITAVKNAQMAQSPLILLGGATATVLKGRGSLQDIDQMALMRPHVKWATSVGKVRHLPRVLERAFQVAAHGVPGPVFVEIPVDLLYDGELVQSWYGAKTGSDRKKRLSEKFLEWYLQWHVKRVFAGSQEAGASPEQQFPEPHGPSGVRILEATKKLETAKRPLFLLGSQSLLEPAAIDDLVLAVEKIGAPVYLSGMARGLLGAGHRLQMRHKRRDALKEADLVILAGVPCDFRLDYGRHIGRATLISANRSRRDLTKNRRPNLGVPGDPGRFLRRLAQGFPERDRGWDDWIHTLRRRDQERDTEIQKKAEAPTEGINPLALCSELERQLDEESVLVADGGDFVATASYIVRPRGPLRWLDPGVFGTLGVGAGFALGAKLVRPEAEVWLIYGDGSSGYSIAEFDTFARHKVPVIALVGNDACWMQIAREQVDVLKDDVGCALARTDYHNVAEGFGGRGLLLQRPDEIPEILSQAKELARQGHPVLINAHIGKTDFRKGSISM